MGRARPAVAVPGLALVVLLGIVLVLVAMGPSAVVRSKARPARALKALKAVAPLPPPPPAADVGAPAQIVTPGADIPDPDVLVEGDRYYYLYSGQTSLDSPHVTVRVSTGLGNLGPASEAMPTLPAWGEPSGFVWAPDVRHVRGRYVMWFSAWLDGSPMTHCIGFALASNPYGPFAAAAEPSICQLDRHGSIDPRTFQAPDGSLWIYWKSDDNSVKHPAQQPSLFVQQLAADGTTLVGDGAEILQLTQPWEEPLIEAPDMVYAGGSYWLFYSGSSPYTPTYALGVAKCSGPTGPCVKPLAGPWLSSNGQGQGPGEESIFTDSRGTWLAYSPWADLPEKGNERPLAVAKLAFGASGPYLAAF